MSLRKKKKDKDDFFSGQPVGAYENGLASQQVLASVPVAIPTEKKSLVNRLTRSKSQSTRHKEKKGRPALSDVDYTGEAMSLPTYTETNSMHGTDFNEARKAVSMEEPSTGGTRFVLPPTRKKDQQPAQSGVEDDNSNTRRRAYSSSIHNKQHRQPNTQHERLYADDGQDPDCGPNGGMSLRQYRSRTPSAPTYRLEELFQPDPGDLKVNTANLAALPVDRVRKAKSPVPDAEESESLSSPPPVPKVLSPRVVGIERSQSVGRSPVLNQRHSPPSQWRTRTTDPIPNNNSNSSSLLATTTTKNPNPSVQAEYEQTRRQYRDSLRGSQRRRPGDQMLYKLYLSGNNDDDDDCAEKMGNGSRFHGGGVGGGINSTNNNTNSDPFDIVSPRFKVAQPVRVEKNLDSDRLVMVPREKLMKESIENYKSHENRILNGAVSKQEMAEALFCFVCDGVAHESGGDYTEYLTPTEIRANYATFDECYVYRILRFCTPCFKEYHRRLLALKEANQPPLLVVQIVPKAALLFQTLQ